MNNTSTTSVTVILVNYNSLNDTNECIKSLSNSTIKPFIIVVDSASVNASEISKQLVAYEYGFQLLLLPENIGFGRANNAGIEWIKLNITTTYVFLLNNDTIVKADTIEKLIEPFSKDELIGLTTCKILFSHDPNLVWYGGGEFNMNRAALSIMDFGKEATADGANKSKFVSFASGCAMMFKNDTLQKLGGFDDRLFMYVEDWELCLRMTKLSYKLWYTSETYILHKVHGSSYSTGKKLPALHPDNPNLSFYIYHFVKNMLLTMHKHLSRSEWRRFFFNYSLLMAYKNITYLLKGRFKANKQFVKAVVDFFNEKKV